MHVVKQLLGQLEVFLVVCRVAQEEVPLMYNIEQEVIGYSLEGLRVPALVWVGGEKRRTYSCGAGGETFHSVADVGAGDARHIQFRGICSP